MNDFEFCVGTDILFGRNQLEKLPAVMGQYGKKILMVYGGGSIKRTGLYDRVKNVLKDFQVFELGGVEPNPRTTTIEKGIRICRENAVDMLLAVGGGSTIDCAKSIAAGVFYDGHVWDMVLGAGQGTITKALPVCTVLTIAATGSEMDPAAVVSNMDTKEKLTMIHPALLPKCSVLEPENTFTVPARQTAAGSADIMSHVMEVYFGSEDTFLTDRICEAILKTVIHFAPLALKEPNNYEARANLMWASSLGLNGLCNAGKAHDWSCHYIEHELSAYYDITHGVGLAIVTPRWMRHILSDKTVGKFADFAVNVWGLPADMDKQELAEKGIDALEQFFSGLGIPMTLREVGITDEHFEEMAQHALAFTGIGSISYAPLGQEDIVKILRACL